MYFVHIFYFIFFAQTKYMENSMTSSTHSFCIFIMTVQKMFRWKLWKYRISYIFLTFLSNLHQNFLSINLTNPNPRPDFSLMFLHHICMRWIELWPPGAVGDPHHHHHHHHHYYYYYYYFYYYYHRILTSYLHEMKRAVVPRSCRWSSSSSSSSSLLLLLLL